MSRLAFLVILAAAALPAQVYDVGPFPKPEPALAFASLKVSSPSGDTLRLPREDWEAARARLAADPEWAAWAAQRRAALDDWIAHRRDRVEWVAGWWHDFVSPRDGSFLTWTPDEPGPTSLSSPSDPQVQLTPKLHGGWVFGFRTRHIDMVFEAARFYRLTGETRYADWAASQLDFYAQNYTKWPLQTAKNKARLMHQSLDDATTIIRLVNAARLLDTFPAPERKLDWTRLLFRPTAALLDETVRRIHNIACWHRSAIAQIAIFAGDDDLWRHALDGPFGIRAQIAHGVTSEYLWFEQSMGYNSYVVSALLPLFTTAALSGRAPDLQHEMHVIHNMLLAPIFIRFPDGRLPNPADATGAQHAPNLPLLASAYRLFPTAPGLRAIAGQRSWDTLLDPPPPPPPPSPLPEPQSLSLPSSRMALLRSGPWQVFFHYGQLNASHAQAEALNFEFTHGATPLSLDPGTVGYGSPLHTGFYRKGAAHNVPLIDGEGQTPWQPGELLHFSPTRAAARQPLYRPGISASRDLHLDGPRLVDTLEITALDGQPRRLGAALHLLGPFTLPDSAEPVEPPLPFWTETRRAQFIDSARLQATFGALTLDILIELPGPFTLTFGRSPGRPPAHRHSLYLETQAPSATIRTTFSAAAHP